MYYRFTLVLEGEQDVLNPSKPGGVTGSEDELQALLQQLEANPESAQEWEDQVHWKREGTVCSACRAVVVRTLSPPPKAAGPH